MRRPQLTLRRTANFSHQSIHCEKCWGRENKSPLHACSPVSPQILNLDTEHDLQAQAISGTLCVSSTITLCSFDPRGMLQSDRKCNPEMLQSICGFLQEGQRWWVSSAWTHTSHLLRSFKQAWLMQSPLLSGPVQETTVSRDTMAVNCWIVCAGPWITWVFLHHGCWDHVLCF